MAQMTIDQLASQLAAVYGDGLRAIALYGSAARGESIARTANLNVLVIVDGIRMEHLRRQAAVTAAWKEAGHPPPLTLTMEEWRGSADIFPMEYTDILEHHRVIAGALPIDGLTVSPAHLRLQLEHEAVSKLLRLRHAVLGAGNDERAQRTLLEGSLSSFLTLLRAVSRLAGLSTPADSEALLATLDGKIPVNIGAFRQVLQLARGGAKADRQVISSILEAYLDAATGLARYADELTA